MKVILLDNLSDSLAEAISTLSNARVLALDCEGVDLGRSGEVCIIQVSTEETCFLFDVFGLTETSELAMALKIVLEDESIVKIIHDCKMDSDALFHLLGIRLAGVHDTQVWDNVITNSEANLNHTLLTYDCPPNTERDTTVYQRNFRFWATRPMTSTMIEWASGDVTCLFQLRTKQIERATSVQRDRATHCSESNARFLRDSLLFETSINARQMGRFIGPGGSNIRGLMNRVPGTYFKVRGVRGNGIVRIYGPNRNSIIRAERLLLRYK